MEELTENIYIFQDEAICNNFLKNIARICCRHKALPVNRFHGSANNCISNQCNLIKNSVHGVYYHVLYILLDYTIL